MADNWDRNVMGLIAVGASVLLLRVVIDGNECISVMAANVRLGLVTLPMNQTSRLVGLLLSTN